MSAFQKTKNILQEKLAQATIAERRGWISSTKATSAMMLCIAELDAATQDAIAEATSTKKKAKRARKKKKAD